MPHDDILTRWRSKGDITEDDYRMGLRVRQTYERSGLVGHATIVTSSRQGRCWTSRGGQQNEALECHEALARMKTYLGEVDNNLMIEVIGKGTSLTDLEVGWAWMGGKEHLARRVRHALRFLDRWKRWGTDLEMIEATSPHANPVAHHLQHLYSNK